MHISVPRGDFTIDNVLCLAETLRTQHREWKDVVVLFFSSDEAAESFDASGMADFREVVDASGRIVATENIGRFRKELRALSVFDVEKHEDYIEITPLGLKSGTPYTTRIELPVTRKAHCRIELRDRCVLAMDEIAFQDEALRARVANAVTLTGHIRPDGTVADVQVVSARGTSGEVTDRLVAASVANLRTWWVEPAPRQDKFRITYSYLVDSSLPRGHVSVQFAMPDRITIRANPPD